MTPPVPQGFSVAGVHCGIKSDVDKEDLALLITDRPAVGVGVYTQNLVVAAPVELDRERTPSDSIRAVVINSGCQCLHWRRGLTKCPPDGQLGVPAMQHSRRTNAGSFDGNYWGTTPDGKH